MRFPDEPAHDRPEKRRRVHAHTVQARAPREEPAFRVLANHAEREHPSGHPEAEEHAPGHDEGERAESDGEGAEPETGRDRR